MPYEKQAARCAKCGSGAPFGGSGLISEVKRLVESGENAVVGVIVALTFGPRAIVAEEGFGALGEGGRLLMVAVVNGERELVEIVRVAIVAELFGNSGSCSSSPVRVLRFEKRCHFVKELVEVVDQRRVATVV